MARETMVSYHHCQKEHGNRGRHERASARKLVAPCNYVSARLHERLCFFAQLSANCFSSCPCLCLLECIFKHQLSELMFDGDCRRKFEFSSESVRAHWPLLWPSTLRLACPRPIATAAPPHLRVIS